MNVQLSRTANGYINVVLKREDSRRAFFYLLGRGATSTKDETDKLAALICRHAGSLERPAYVAHLGTRSIGVSLGGVLTYGSPSEQRRRLGEFLDQAASELGVYGSWWEESFWLMSQTLAYTLAAFPVELVLMQDVAARAPFEWREDDFRSWLNERKNKWGFETDRLTLVSRVSTLGPFVVAPFSQTLGLGEWLDAPIAQGNVTSDRARLNLYSPDKGLGIIESHTPTAKVVKIDDNQYVIDIVRPGASWPAELHVAMVPWGSERIECKLQWL